MRISTLVLAAALLTAVLAAAARAQDARTPRKPPNILFVFIDDMGYGDLGCFGNDRIQTPAIDRLAREGVRFTQFYVNSPICSPSRVAVTTGQYPSRWRITSFLANRQEDKRRGMADWLDPAAPSLARFLQRAGYHTAHVGKWHMGGQRDIADAPMITEYGFDTSLTSFEGRGPRILPRLENRPFGLSEQSAAVAGPGAQWEDRHNVSARFVDRAIAEIDRAAKAGKPFYVNLWPDDVHSPHQAPPDLRGDGSPAAHYSGVLRTLDRQLGRVFDHVRSRPELRDNTLILLASDNGAPRGPGSSGGLRGTKGQLYEGGIRSPLIVWAPGVMPKSAVGTTNDKTLLAGMDLPPSLLALAGVPAPADARFDGIDASPALSGRAAPAGRPGPVMWVKPPREADEVVPAGLAIRDGQWKLLVARDGTGPELYDIAADPAEKENLADRHPDVVTRLTRQVLAWDKSARPQQP